VIRHPPPPNGCLALRQPVGVVGAITPWNFPGGDGHAKDRPAIAAGCTVVLKPAEQTPLTALKIAAIMGEAGLPPGVCNVIPPATRAGRDGCCRTRMSARSRSRDH